MQDWSRVSQEAKDRKSLKKRIARDKEREVRIERLGGLPVDPNDLSEKERQERIDYMYTLMYPERFLPKHKRSYVVENNKKYPRRSKPKGSERTERQFLSGILRTNKFKAQRDNIPFNLSLDHLKVPEVCPVLGIKLDWGTDCRDNTPSLDRLKPEVGYTVGNVRVISHRANRLKQDASIAELRKIISYIEKNTT